MRVAAFLVVWLVMCAPAVAQSTYVGGSFMGELSRFGGVDIDDGDGDFRIATGTEPLSRDGETIGFDVRAGRSLGERWGVELAFARGGTNERTQTRSLGDILGTRTPLLPTLPGIPTLPTLPIADFEYELRFQQQHTTIDTMAWFRQELGDRFDLAFLGGVSFSRVESEQSLEITDPRLAIYLPYPTGIETVSYGAGAVVGTEGIIKLTDHAAVTAGVRLHSVAGGWLIRPAAGLRWQF